MVDKTDIESAKRRAQLATVEVAGSGQGVLVPGNLILTAAHCINWNLVGDMAYPDQLSGPRVEKIIAAGETLQVQPLAVEPMSDIAVLSALDYEQFPSEYEAFQRFCDRTPPVRVSFSEIEILKSIQVHIWSHEKKWISGKATQAYPGVQSLVIDLDKAVQKGTSGGPIIDEYGDLCSIVSCGGAVITDSTVTHYHKAPRPHRALPVWVTDKIKRLTEE